MTRRAVLIFPGRGTYNAPELGYLSRHHGLENDTLRQFDAHRKSNGHLTVSDLDGAAKFEPETYSTGSVASALIFACGALDAQVLADDIEIVAITGNSMGWYTALAAASAVSFADGFRVADTMGRLMEDHGVGGQTVYPFVADDWQSDEVEKQRLLNLISDIASKPQHQLSLSIDLGGMLVVAGDIAGLAAFEKAVPQKGVFPLRLKNHAAFHTHMQQKVAQLGRQALADIDWSAPNVPIIDGTGKIWWPDMSDLQALAAYTLGDQICETYNFTKAVQVAAKEFAPDLFVVAGPGTTLGGAVAQSLVGCGWLGMRDRDSFLQLQAETGVLSAMGRDDQRRKVDK
ncbi:ACP S-malonyltransferase [Ascidiaceihabitans sp.]|uniref:ACP S-malonyltransferase n=1 Tax=Ascidiaceihabitans sp. TaxID=1872644 RepID=UPI00329A334C